MDHHGSFPRYNVGGLNLVGMGEDDDKPSDLGVNYFQTNPCVDNDRLLDSMNLYLTCGRQRRKSMPGPVCFASLSTTLSHNYLLHVM